MAWVLYPVVNLQAARVPNTMWQIEWCFVCVKTYAKNHLRRIIVAAYVLKSPLRPNLTRQRILKARKDRLKEDLIEIPFHILPDKNPVKYNILRELKMAEMQVLSVHIEKLALALKDSDMGMSKLEALRQRLKQKDEKVTKGKWLDYQLKCVFSNNFKKDSCFNTFLKGSSIRPCNFTVYDHMSSLSSLNKYVSSVG